MVQKLELITSFSSCFINVKQLTKDHSGYNDLFTEIEF